MISFPAAPGGQEHLIERIQAARAQVRDASTLLKHEMLALSDVIDGRGEEELPEIVPHDSNGDNGDTEAAAAGGGVTSRGLWDARDNLGAGPRAARGRTAMFGSVYSRRAAAGCCP